MSDAEEGHSSSNIAVVSASNTNLNMASALTHVGGDTLRTGAVFVAAMVARYVIISTHLLPKHVMN
jgi:Co/Zn/Cd efflux system component